MRVRKFARDREAEPRPVGSPSDKRLEEVITQLGRHARAGIGDGEPEPIPSCDCTEFDVAAGRRVPHRVDEQIFEDATDNFRVKKSAG
jgi:hypothetical protein